MAFGWANGTDYKFKGKHIWYTDYGVQVPLWSKRNSTAWQLVSSTHRVRQRLCNGSYVSFTMRHVVQNARPRIPQEWLGQQQLQTNIGMAAKGYTAGG